MLAFNVYAKKDKRMNERTNEVNGIFSRIYIYTSVREEDIIGDMKSGLPFFFFGCYLVIYIVSLYVLKSRKKRINDF
jgi:hypothetical protein